MMMQQPSKNPVTVFVSIEDRIRSARSLVRYGHVFRTGDFAMYIYFQFTLYSYSVADPGGGGTTPIQKISSKLGYFDQIFDLGIPLALDTVLAILNTSPVRPLDPPLLLGHWHAN